MPRDKQSGERMNMKECRLCKTANDDSVVFCRVCGTKFPDLNNQEEITPEAVNLLNELKEIKALLQTIAMPQNAKECKILTSNPYSGSGIEDITTEINKCLSEGWIVSGFTADSPGEICVLLTRYS